MWDKLRLAIEREPIFGPWLKRRRHKKELANIHKNLLDNPKLLFDTKEKFEKAFGKDSKKRSPEQWMRLVNVYGIDQVSKTEVMTIDHVNAKCNETFSQRLKKEFKLKAV